MFDLLDNYPQLKGSKGKTETTLGFLLAVMGFAHHNSMTLAIH
jgi:hypothetical protein